MKNKLVIVIGVVVIVMSVFLMTGCSSTEEDEMIEILEDMVLNASGNVIAEEAYCNLSQYAIYFEIDNEDYISCEGEDGYYEYITHIFTKYYSSTNQVNVEYEIDEGSVTYYITENDERVVLAITMQENPFIIIGIE